MRFQKLLLVLLVGLMLAMGIVFAQIIPVVNPDISGTDIIFKQVAEEDMSIQLGDSVFTVKYAEYFIIDNPESLLFFREKGLRLLSDIPFAALLDSIHQMRMEMVKSIDTTTQDTVQVLKYRHPKDDIFMVVHGDSVYLTGYNGESVFVTNCSQKYVPFMVVYSVCAPVKYRDAIVRKMAAKLVLPSQNIIYDRRLQRGANFMAGRDSALVALDHGFLIDSARVPYYFKSGIGGEECTLYVRQERFTGEDIFPGLKEKCSAQYGIFSTSTGVLVVNDVGRVTTYNIVHPPDPASETGRYIYNTLAQVVVELIRRNNPDGATIVASRYFMEMGDAPWMIPQEGPTWLAGRQWLSWNTGGGNPNEPVVAPTELVSAAQ